MMITVGRVGKLLRGMLLFAAVMPVVVEAQGSVVSLGWAPPNGYPGDNHNFIAVKCNEGCSPIGTYAQSYLLTVDGHVIAWEYSYHWANGWSNGIDTLSVDNVVAIASSSCHGAAALRQDGSVIVLNGDSLDPPPAPNSGFTAVAAACFHRLGLRPDGSIVAWGHNDYGQLNVPEPNVGYVAFACGGRYIQNGWGYSLAVTAAGSIIGWGAPSAALDVPEPNSDFVAVETDAEIPFSVGLKRDGSLVGWGYPGPLTVPPPDSPIIAFDIGSQGGTGIPFVVALHADGTLSRNGASLPENELVAVSAGGAAFMAIQGYATAGIGAASTPREPALTLVPNPFTNSTEILAAGPLVSIYNSAGRLVRSLPGGRWDGRDERGVEVPSGVYLLTSGTRNARAIKLR